ncbi:MAG: DUF3795 domain-containing protein [Negativicutes bacterium]|jgi:hypothetical protein
MSKEYIGCCGAYCRTCKAFTGGSCKGCKLGYDSGGRDFSKAKCVIKRCCIGKNLATCADCEQYHNCSLINDLLAHTGYKYKKYHQALEFIREHGYAEFLACTDNWKNAYGKF